MNESVTGAEATRRIVQRSDANSSSWGRLRGAPQPRHGGRRGGVATRPHRGGGAVGGDGGRGAGLQRGGDPEDD